MASPAGSVRSTSSQESKDSRARLEDIRARINAKKELSLSLASEVSLSDIGQQVHQALALACLFASTD